MSGTESNVGQELTTLNYQYLLMAQKKLLQNPIVAKHKLGIDDQTADFLGSMSASEIQKLAESGVCTVKFRFDKASIEHLSNFVSGDDMAITQAVLGNKQ